MDTKTPTEPSRTSSDEPVVTAQILAERKPGWFRLTGTRFVWGADPNPKSQAHSDTETHLIFIDGIPLGAVFLRRIESFVEAMDFYPVVECTDSNIPGRRAYLFKVYPTAQLENPVSWGVGWSREAAALVALQKILGL